MVSIAFWTILALTFLVYNIYIKMKYLIQFITFI